MKECDSNSVWSDQKLSQIQVLRTPTNDSSNSSRNRNNYNSIKNNTFSIGSNKYLKVNKLYNIGNIEKIEALVFKNVKSYNSNPFVPKEKNSAWYQIDETDANKQKKVKTNFYLKNFLSIFPIFSIKRLIMMIGIFLLKIL